MSTQTKSDDDVKKVEMESKQQVASSSKKSVVVIGATGRCGMLFVSAALEDGHSVTAIVRNKPARDNTLSTSIKRAGDGAYSKLDSGAAHQVPPHDDVIAHENLKVVVADITSEEELTPVLKGHDAVVVTLGAWPKDTNSVPPIYGAAAKAYVPAMKANKIRRLLCVFGLGFAQGDALPSPRTGSILGCIQCGMMEAYKQFSDQGIDFTIACPPDLPAGKRSSEYVTAVNHMPADCQYICTSGMIADFLCKELVSDQFINKRVAIAAKKSYTQ